jgi:hypothetical protein
MKCGLVVGGRDVVAGSWRCLRRPLLFGLSRIRAFGYSAVGIECGTVRLAPMCIFAFLASCSSTTPSRVSGHLPSLPSSARVQDPIVFGSFTAVSCGIAPWLRSRERPWLVERRGLSRGEAIAVKCDYNTGGSLIDCRIAVSYGFESTSLDIRLYDSPVSGYRVDLTVQESTDYAAPVVWTDVAGRVLFGADPRGWLQSGAQGDLLLSFDLSACSVSPLAHLQGIVCLPGRK